MSHSNQPLAESGITIPSDSERYGEDDDSEGISAQSSPSPARVVLYQPPTLWTMLRSTAINLLLPFVNGMMLGFGELFAHEAAFRLGWSGTKIFPLSRRQRHPIGPGLEIRDRSRISSNINDLLALD